MRMSLIFSWENKVFDESEIWHDGGAERWKVKGSPKIVRIHRLGTVDVCTKFYGNPSTSCLNISVWIKLVDWQIPGATPLAWPKDFDHCLPAYDHIWSCVRPRPLVKTVFWSFVAMQKHISTLWLKESSAILVNHWFIMSWCYFEVLGVPAIFWISWLWCGIQPVKKEERRGKEKGFRLKC